MLGYFSKRDKIVISFALFLFLQSFGGFVLGVLILAKEILINMYYVIALVLTIEAEMIAFLYMGVIGIVFMSYLFGYTSGLIYLYVGFVYNSIAALIILWACF